MKIALRCFHWVLLIVLTSACAASPATETSSPLPATTQPATATLYSPTLTASPVPTNTIQPTAYPTIASTPVQPVIGLPQGTDDYPWWNDAVFYEIFVRSFYDSDGNGIGDFNGITSKLDYLNDGDPNTNTDLGINAIWLMPINPSPSYHGYDVTDYYDVNPQYGTMDDFKLLVSEAHKRGIRVTIDWVLNHTSTQSEWFRQALDPNSPYYDWYVWSTTPAQGKWYPASNGQYYYSRFGAEYGDLNYLNTDVTAEMEKVARFWLKDVGIDGFRLDAAKHLIEDGAVSENTAGTHDWYKGFRNFYKKINPQAFTVGEVANDSNTVATYIQGDQLDLAFDFDLAKNMVFSAGTHDPKYFTSTLNHDLTIFQPGQFATFLTNHDQDRAMSVLNGDVDAAKTAAMLMLTSPGVPFLYYGEEIGMTGKKPDENIRLPMQWTSDVNAGFSTGTPWRAPGGDYPIKNVAAQSADPNSLLSLYRELIHIRNNHAALRVGDFHLINSGNRSVYASLRISKEETVLILINMSSSPVSDYSLKLESSHLSGNYMVSPLLGYGEFLTLQVNEHGDFADYLPMPEIPANGRIILQLQKEIK